jgi:hypothetical protein
VPIAQLIIDVGISFIPIIGPLYGLAQAGMAAYHAYKNWDKMSGWEKGLVGVTVLLSVVPALRAGTRAARGIATFRKGVDSLVKAGLPASEARRLMLAGAVFQSEKAALRTVDALGDALRRGERLTAAELQQMKGVFHLMLQRLPVAERTAIAASFATADLKAARQFFAGVELTERHLAGLRKLAPEALADLQKAAASEPILVSRVALWAERSGEVALAVNHLQGVVRPAHLARVLTEAGEDVLTQIGRHRPDLSPELLAFVRKARTAGDAYRRLMQGTVQGGRKIAGLGQALARTYPEALAPALAAARQEFARTFLTVEHLEGLARLNPAARTALKDASDSQLRYLAGVAARSQNAAKAINQIADQLRAVLPRNHLPAMLDGVGGGLLEAAGSAGVTLSEDLVKQIARQATAGKATRVLLEGFTRGAKRVPGLLDEVAGRLTSVSSAERALRRLETPALQGKLFARWALAHPDVLKRTAPDLAEGIALIQRTHGEDALAKISGIYRAFAASHQTAVKVFESLAKAENRYGTNINLGRLVSELAAGAEKSMGASLTLNYITARELGAVTGLEHEVANFGVKRVYDLAAGGISYEFKFWLGFGGRPAAAAADEFARDVVLHAATGFSQLQWVISKNAGTTLPAIESMMRGVLARPWVQAALQKQGISLREARARLDAALQKGLVEFF